ncbi:unnamed protein product [Cladocopium goreaui]|uniref:Uncharacterized protein n=1 Tax=Cladocopium goreaui TaxID=2562237 RepID=A0A9P1C2H5_9DINO|nr:unnamed protein product [Cladocopium goreaui]
MKMTEQMKTDLEELHHIAEKEPDFYVLDFECRRGGAPDNWSRAQASDRI